MRVWRKGGRDLGTLEEFVQHVILIDMTVVFQIVRTSGFFPFSTYPNPSDASFRQLPGSRQQIAREVLERVQ